jgi:ComF family protein
LSIGAAPRAAARGLLTGVLDLLLPRVCVACERALDEGERDVVCGRCWTRIAPLPHPQCSRCGHPTRGHACRWCALLPPYVRAVRSVCWATSGTGGTIIHALKYDGWTGAAAGMAARIARLPWPLDVTLERTAVVPVPLAPVRLRERGYNQSALLARAVGAAWSCPVWESVLERTRATQTQTRLTSDERLRNVSGAFRAVSAARPTLRGAHVVLVDDVVTTASTLNASAAALILGGARIVSYATFGRAPALGDHG